MSPLGRQRRRDGTLGGDNEGGPNSETALDGDATVGLSEDRVQVRVQVQAKARKVGVALWRGFQEEWDWEVEEQEGEAGGSYFLV